MQVMSWLHLIWNFLFSSASIATAIGCGAVAVAVLEPKVLDRITDLRKWAIGVAVVAFSFTAIAGKFYHDGINATRAEWDAALARQAEQGEADRAAAVAAVPADAADRRVFDADPRNRDARPRSAEPQGQVRRLASDLLFRKRRHAADHPADPHS
jgi:hypothetical protein